MPRWLHAPGHSGSVRKGVIQFAIKKKPLLIDWSEMYRNIADLEKHGVGYQHFVGKKRRTDARNRVVNHDVVISVRDDAEIIHQEEFFVSKEIPSNLKYMPERWGKAVVVRHAGEVILLLAWHPQPNPLRRRDLVLPSYRRGVRRVEAVQSRLEAAFSPDLVLNGGDLQLGPGSEEVHPNQMAKRTKMRYRRVHIDWQLWKGAYRVVSFKKHYPSTVNKGMDHVWTMLNLRKKAS